VKGKPQKRDGVEECLRGEERRGEERKGEEAVCLMPTLPSVSVYMFLYNLCLNEY